MPGGALGVGGVLTIGSEARQVKDVNTDMGASEVDGTTRDNDGWEEKRAGLRNWSVSFSMKRVTGDSVYTTLRTAFIAGSTLNITVRDALGESISGAVSVTKFSKGEPLSGYVMMDVVLSGSGKPTFS